MFDIGKEKFQEIINNSSSFREAIRKMNCNDNSAGAFYIFKKRIKEWNIDLTLLVKKRKETGKTNSFCKITDEEIFIKNCNYGKGAIKKRLYKYKANKCDICKFEGEWNGKAIILIMDHIDGDRYNNELENLRFVCPMCNSQLPTHCGGNKFKKYHYCECGGIRDKGAIKCKKCASFNSRKVKERPSLKTILNLVDEFGYEGTGEKYNVGGNCIKKWIRSYGEEPPAKLKRKK